MNQLSVWLILLIISMSFFYLKTYIGEKAKNKALLKDKLNLTRQIECLKKEHELEIAKRKYQYESKKDQYINFFQMLDSFSGKQNIKTVENITPIINDFYSAFLRATNNSEEQYKASSLFMERIQNLMNENNTEFIRLKQETNTIRLIASDEVISLLNDLEKIYEDMFDISNIIIKNIPHNIIENNQNELQTNRVLIEQIAQNAITIKNKLILQMRDDLSKI
ncbi:hypothetical protein [Phocaeicola sp.]|uniref:hypothetical protein n=1 Tax=Phocaeicola sp. TaxID=2773926 RepID=UPI0030786EDF